ncbi:MAG: hypothetical protein A4E66_02317 [Syntrophus sp. PtaB.Bin001]|nr:MAG: hypothetical protein A4E66_02317 [Syntrophus sp. PtaB.Bin001]
MHLQAVSDVVRHREVRKERQVLEEISDPASMSRYVVYFLSVETDLASVTDQPGNHVEDRRLSRTIGSD